MRNFVGCSAIIYDENDKELANARISRYSDRENSIEIGDLSALKAGMLCKILILSAPAPHIYDGRIRRNGLGTTISLFNEDTAENRQDIRYKVDLPASVEGIISGNKVIPLHAMVEARVVNISKNGVRFRAVTSVLSKGDKFQIRLKSGDIDKLLRAEAIFMDDSSPKHLEFGCRLLGEEEQ